MDNTMRWKSVHFAGCAAAILALFVPFDSIFGYSFSFYDAVSMLCDSTTVFFCVWLPLVLFIASAVALLLDYYKYAEYILHASGIAYIGAGLYWVTEEDSFTPLVLVMIGGVICGEVGIYFLLAEEEKKADTKNIPEQISAASPKKEASPRLIEFISGDFQGAEIPLEGELVIGKNAAVCNIVVTDKTCSRIHCKISFDEKAEKYMVRDFSTNGTYLGNGERLAKESDILLERGTVLSIGSGENRFKLK